MAKQLGYPCTDVIPLTQDASARKYFKLKLKPRIKGDDPSIVILCFLDPQQGSHKDFIHISKYIDIGPEILAYDLELGVTIQSYAGQHNYQNAPDRWDEQWSEDFYTGGTHESEHGEFKDDCKDGEFGPSYRNEPRILLNKFINSNIPKLKKISDKKLMSQMHMFQNIFLNKFLGSKSINKEIDNEIKTLQIETLEELKKQEWVNCHTDFEHRNIMVRMDRSPYAGYVTLIDYQDSCIGPEGIDLAGIYVLHHKPFKFHHRFNPKTVEKIRWGGIQRNMRILGTLANLYLEQKRSFRLIDLPQILENLIYLIPEKYKKLKTLLRNDAEERLPTKVLELIGNPLKSNQAMILAAGYGKRMLPLTKNTPKPLLKINNDTLLDLHLNKLLDADFDEIFINVAYLGEKIKTHVKKNFDKNITIIDEKKPLGTGGALINASKKHFNNDDWILVINADIYCDIDLKKLRHKLHDVIWDHAKRLQQVKVLLVGVPNPSHNKKGDFYSAVTGRARIPTYEYHQYIHYPDHLFTWSGISFIHGSVFEEFNISNKTPFDSWSNIIKPLIESDKVAIYEHIDNWVDVGTPGRLKFAKDLMEGKINMHELHDKAASDFYEALYPTPKEDKEIAEMLEKSNDDLGAFSDDDIPF